MFQSRAASATFVGMLLLLCPSCSVADLTSGGPLDSSSLDTIGDDPPRDAESVVPPHEAGLVKVDGGGTADSSGGSADGGDGSGATIAPPSTVVSIQNLYNRFYLDVENASTDSGAHVVTNPYTGASNQVWSFIGPLADGTYEIVNQLSNDCLDVPDDIDANGMYLQQWTCWPLGDGEPPNLGQRWTLVSFAEYVHIVGKGTGKCLMNNSILGNAYVDIWDCNSDQWEQWAVAPVQ
jgi:hypothetical protein